MILCCSARLPFLNEVHLPEWTKIYPAIKVAAATAWKGDWVQRFRMASENFRVKKRMGFKRYKTGDLQNSSF